MLIEFEADYKAGGYPTPTYRGTVAFGIYVSETADQDEIQEEALEKARRLAAEKSCFSVFMVKIEKLRQISYRKY